MIETIGCTIMLSIIVLGVVSVTLSIEALRAKTADSVLLATHNLNCIERLRQLSTDPYEELLLFYGDETFGSSSIETEVSLDEASWGSYNVWCVTVSSKVRGTGRRLVSTFTLTDIGGIDYSEDLG